MTLSTLLESAARLCASDHAWLLRRQGECFSWLASYGHATEIHTRIRDYFSTRAIPLDRGSIVGQTMLEAKTVQVSDVLADPQYALIDLQNIAGYRAALGVPLLREGHVVGAIFLARAVPQPFTDRQIELIETFADQAVIAKMGCGSRRSKTQIDQNGYSAKFAVLHNAAQTAMMRSVEPG